MLANEDNLRIQVLLRQSPQVIRINESNMTLFALTPKGEASIKLHPHCRDEKYLMWVRELLSSHALGSPQGYPTFLKRWRRMDDRRSENLRPLLLLGEPEAIIDVAYSPHLDVELANHVWWAMQTSEIARLLLRNPTIAQSTFARTLVDFLLEFLPFETEPRDIVETTSVLLQPGLLREEEINSLWQRAERKVVFYIGFLHSIPDTLPMKADAHVDFERISHAIQDTLNNDVGHMLCRLYAPAGQAFLQTVKTSLTKLPDQETTLALFNALQQYFSDLSFARLNSAMLAQAKVYADEYLCEGTDSRLNVMHELVDKEVLQSLIQLAQTREAWLNPVFSQTDAIGSVMRKKLQPMSDVLIEAIDTLIGKTRQLKLVIP